MVSGTAIPEHSMSRIISTTRCSNSGSSIGSPPDSGMIFQPFRPPREGRMEKLNSWPLEKDLLIGRFESPVGPGVPHLELDLELSRDLSRLARKLRACFSSLLSSRARLDEGDPGGVPPAKRGESERIGDRPRQIGLDPRESLAMFIGALFIASILLFNKSQKWFGKTLR